MIDIDLGWVIGILLKVSLDERSLANGLAVSVEGRTRLEDSIGFP